MKTTLPCAEALQAALSAERVADWKEGGRVQETARRAAQRAEDKFLTERLKYHGINKKQEI